MSAWLFRKNFDESNIVRLSTFLNPLANSSRLATFDNGLFEAQMVPLLFNSLNLSYQLQTPPDVMASGSLLNNGTWTGCMGQIQRQETDMCVSLSSPSSLRCSVADFSFPLMFERLTIIMPPPAVIHKAMMLIMPLSWEVWLSLVACTILMIVTLNLAHLHKNVTSPIYWGLYLFGNRSGHYLPEYRKNISSILILTWFVPTVVLISCYKAIYFSMLAVPHYTHLVDDAEQLKQNPDIAVHVIKDASVQELFLNEKEFESWGDQLRQNSEQVIPRVNLARVPDMIRGRKVFIAPESEAYSIWRLDPKRLVRCPKSFYTRQRSMFHPKNSILTPFIDNQLMLLHQHGLVDYQVRRTMPGLIPPQWTTKEKLDPFLQFNIYDLSGGFFVLAVGWTLAIIILIIEQCVKTMQIMLCFMSPFMYS